MEHPQEGLILNSLLKKSRTIPSLLLMHVFMIDFVSCEDILMAGVTVWISFST